jgi:hypothetical protein
VPSSFGRPVMPGASRWLDPNAVIPAAAINAAPANS